MTHSASRSHYEDIRWIDLEFVLIYTYLLSIYLQNKKGIDKLDHMNLNDLIVDNFRALFIVSFLLLVVQMNTYFFKHPN